MNIAGVDEAGRGPLAGPVVAAAVVLDPRRPIRELADSKTLSAGKREELAAVIRRRAAAWAIGWSEVDEIDRLNILNATLLAMQRAVLSLNCSIDLVLVDGNRSPQFDAPSEAIVKGDAKVAAISAASILAKQARDEEMQRLHQYYPDYGFDRHKGYPTVFHRQQIVHIGPCRHHRRSFTPVKDLFTR